MTLETADSEDEDNVVEIQKKIAKSHYSELKERSLLKLFMNAVPAILFTVAAVWFYFGVEEGTPFIGQFYNDGLSFVLLTLIIASILCWGLFFWIQVKRNHEQAALWEQSMKIYEDLMNTEKELKQKSDEERRRVSRESAEQLQREVLMNENKAY